MIQFSATIEQFEEKGEKTGWSFVKIPASIAVQLNPANKKSFHVKGFIDSYKIAQVCLLPMGGGHYILAMNAVLRKGVGKRKGATVTLQLQKDETPFTPPADLITCLADEPEALAHFNTMPASHQKYFCKWIEGVKGDAARSRRISQTVAAMLRRQNYAEMIHWNREHKLA